MRCWKVVWKTFSPTHQESSLCRPTPSVQLDPEIHRLGYDFQGRGLYPICRPLLCPSNTPQGPHQLFPLSRADGGILAAPFSTPQGYFLDLRELALGQGNPAGKNDVMKSRGVGWQMGPGQQGQATRR